MNKNYTELFNRDFLGALSDWQKGWNEIQDKRRELADKLVKVCENIPVEFRVCDADCYRKRFIVDGEIVPIILNDNFFDGITSWTLDLNFTKNFKYLIKPETKFAIIFRQKPIIKDIVVNIASLWQNDHFKRAVDNLHQKEPDIAYPLLNFKDFQSEIVLRTTLRGSEIEHIVGISSTFEEICDKGGIPEIEREALSVKYARDPNGIPISFPTYASNSATREAVKKTILCMKVLIEDARQNDVEIYNLVYEPHPEDLKHLIK